MIIKFGDPLKSFGGAIGYHESKVEKGEAEMLIDTTYTEGVKAKSDYLEQVVAQNPKVTTNKGFDIASGFHPSENLSNQEMRILAMETVNGLGYENCPFVVYRHFDKPHGHFHIVVTSVDMDGKKIQEFGNHIKAKKLGSQLEKKYALRHTDLQKQSGHKKDYQVEHYSIARASKDFGSVPAEGLTVNDLQDKSNYQIQTEYGKEVYDHLFAFYEKEGYQMVSEKQRLEEKLYAYRKQAQSLRSFENQLRKEGFYVKKLHTGNYVYKMPDGEFYFSTKKQLSTTFSESKLKSYFGKATTTSKDVGRDYVKRMAERGMNSSKSMDEFVSYCYEKGVAVQFSTYSDGRAYGMSFTNIKTGETFKGSQIGISLQNALSKFHPSMQKSKPFYPMRQLRKAQRLASDIGYTLSRGNDQPDRTRE